MIINGNAKISPDHLSAFLQMNPLPDLKLFEKIHLERVIPAEPKQVLVSESLWSEKPVLIMLVRRAVRPSHP
jgi:hypothetical protein